MRTLWREPRARSGRSGTAAEPIEPLTAREEDVLLAVARGRTNTEVGQELSISLGSVKTHVASLMGKLGVRNRVEIALWAYQSGRLRD